MLEWVFKVNELKYRSLIEHDLIQIMRQKKISYIFPFFDTNDKEMLGEHHNHDHSINCNFEIQLKSEKLPSTWYNKDTKQIIYQLLGDQNQEDEIINRLKVKREENIIEVEECEVVHTITNFQNL